MSYSFYIPRYVTEEGITIDPKLVVVSVSPKNIASPITSNPGIKVTETRDGIILNAFGP